MYNITMCYAGDIASYNTGYELVHSAWVTLAVEREINIKNVDREMQQKFLFIIPPSISLSKI